MSRDERAKNVEAYLKNLDVEGLNDLLGKVLAELRLRAAHQMGVDMIRHSRKLPRVEPPPAVPDEDI